VIVYKLVLSSSSPPPSYLTADRRPVCPGVRPQSGPVANFSFPLKCSLDSRGFVVLWRPLWREDGSAIYCCCLASPAQSLWGLSPVGLKTIFYCSNFWDSPNLEGQVPVVYPPGTAWHRYTPEHWVTFTSPLTTRMAIGHCKDTTETCRLCQHWAESAAVHGPPAGKHSCIEPIAAPPSFTRLQPWSNIWKPSRQFAGEFHPTATWRSSAQPLQLFSTRWLTQLVSSSSTECTTRLKKK
jgi:hypothetical protein